MVFMIAARASGVARLSISCCFFSSSLSSINMASSAFFPMPLCLLSSYVKFLIFLAIWMILTSFMSRWMASPLSSRTLSKLSASTPGIGSRAFSMMPSFFTCAFFLLRSPLRVKFSVWRSWTILGPICSFQSNSPVNLLPAPPSASLLALLSATSSSNSSSLLSLMSYLAAMSPAVRSSPSISATRRAWASASALLSPIPLSKSGSSALLFRCEGGDLPSA
mmetsp:Transcript_5153/g.10869  ORF Transcript_5153/g.10869 Transcript_5153/m.10869 type:complete len:221 (-) Transcript_5153:309-971(-)